MENGIATLRIEGRLTQATAGELRASLEFLIDYLHGALPAAERTRFEEHLTECPDCVGYLESYEATIKLGKAAFRHPEEPAPPDVPEALLRAILAARRGQ